MAREQTPWAVWCTGLMEDYPSCGKQFLTEEEYDEQMSHPNRGWHCPLCGADANWDDDNYEKAMDALAAKGKSNFASEE